VQHVHDAQARGVEPSLPIRVQHLRVGMALSFVCRQRGLQIGRVPPSRLQGHVVCPVSPPYPRRLSPSNIILLAFSCIALLLTLRQSATAHTQQRQEIEDRGAKNDTVELPTWPMYTQCLSPQQP
jgi:hypothetical protein